MDHNQTITVAHFCLDFLLRTETFIYQFVTRTPQTRDIVITFKRHHPEEFPFPHLYSRNDDAGLLRILDKIYRLTHSRHSVPRSFFVEKIISQQKPDIVHAHFGDAALYGLSVRRRFNIPLVTSFYGKDMSELPQLLYYQKMYPVLFDKGDAFLVEGNYMKRALAQLGCPQEKIYVRHIGVDIERFTYHERSIASDKRINILMCCRFCEKKGVEDAVEAFHIAAQRNPHLFLRIIGDAATKEEIVIKKKIVKLIRDYNLKDRVALLGWLTYDEYRAESDKAHIFMQPSKTAASGDTEGGAPTVILEMQAAGLPIISTYHADIPETVKENESAYLSGEGDREALARNIIRMIDNPHKWPQMGQAGREHVKNNYNIKDEAHKLYTIYKELCRKRQV